MAQVAVNEEKLLEAMNGSIETTSDSAPPARGGAPDPKITGALAIMTQTKAHVEEVTAYILETTKTLRREIDELERLALDDLTHVKSEIDAHVVGAEAIVRSVRDIGKMVEEIKSKRAKLLPRAR